MSVKTPHCPQCGHVRRSHSPAGCAECECEERAPAIIVRKDGTECESWQGSRPPFTAGNVVAARHGANSPRLVSERSQAVLAELMESFPWLAEADVMMVEVLCRAKAVFDSVDTYIADVVSGEAEAYPRRGVPSTGVEAVPDQVWQQWRGSLKLVIDASAKLGLNPVDRAMLLKDAGWAKQLAGDRIGELVTNGRMRLESRGRS